MHYDKRIIRLAIPILFLFSCAAYFVFAAENSKQNDKELYKQIELFSDTLSIIQSDYVEEPKPKDLIYGALEGMLSSLDGYSHFLDPDSFKEMEIGTKGEFGGLGIEIGIRDDALTVISPIDGTPAEKAGVKAGDKIVKIDGDSTRDVTLADAVKKLRGRPRTSVNLTVYREGEEKLLDFKIVRAIIKLKSIKKAEIINCNIGYVRLVEFQEKTASELERQIVRLKKEGMEGLILDIRNNPGGLLDSAYDVSDKFLPEGSVIVSLQGRTESMNKVFKASGKNNFTDFPIVVLVNEGSASASEIVAGAMQDNKRGVIVGMTTFGKGSVQTIIPLKDGSAVRLTTSAYYTPSGRSLMDKGIVPDVEVELREKNTDEKRTEEDIKENPFTKIDGEEAKSQAEEYDNQIEAALGVLKGILIYEKGEE